jgi:hypothetical protein
MPDDFSHAQLELVEGPNLPAPHDLVGMLRAKLEELITAAREGRGEVLTPEDTYEIHRGLVAVIEGLEDYARAFTTIAKEAKGYVEDELIEAVGESDGIPLVGLRVPDVDGTTVVISLDTANEYVFDHAALRSAVAYSVLMTSPADRQASDELLINSMVDAMALLETLGQFKPQVTKVRAFTNELARLEGGPAIASTVTSTIRKNPTFRGVKIRRERLGKARGTT